MPQQQPPTGENENPLLTSIIAGKTPDARLHTLLAGWMSGIQTANRDGTMNPTVKAYIAQETGRINAYCGAVLGTGAQQATGAGGKTGG